MGVCIVPKLTYSSKHSAQNYIESSMEPPCWMTSLIKARLHRQFLSWQLDAIFKQKNRIKFQTCSKPPRCRGDKSHWKSHLVYTRDFEVATLARQKLHWVSATKIACVNPLLENLLGRTGGRVCWLLLWQTLWFTLSLEHYLETTHFIRSQSQILLIKDSALFFAITKMLKTFAKKFGSQING